jgi:hypothetical protein
MTNTASRSIRVFPAPVNVVTLPIPPDYPILPLNNIQYQPVAYTQATPYTIFVTVLIPLLSNQTIVAPSVIEECNDQGAYSFEYTLVINGSSGSQQPDAIALLSFSFMLSGITDYKVKIIVNGDGQPDTSDPLGKVVMDSNMEPSSNG